MRAQLLLPILGLVLLAAQASGQDAGQPTTVLEKGNQLRQLLREVAKYPPELRRAAVIVAQHPKLLGRLYDATHEPNARAAAAEVLKSFPQEVQEAGNRLVASPEILEVLIGYTPLAEMVGEAYKRLGEEKLKEIIAELKKDDSKTEESLKKWSQRLARNKEALQEFLDAVSAYTEEAKQEGHRDYGLGVAVNAKNQAIVYALPAAPLTAYVLVNADLYSELADEMVEQWLTTSSNDDFDVVMAQWWLVIHQHFKPAILEPHDRPDRLKALALLAKKLGEERQDKPATIEDRVKFLEANAASFPALKPFHLEKPVAPPAPGADGDVKIPKPRVSRKATMAAVVTAPPPPRTPPAKKTPEEPAAPARTLPTAVAQEAPTPEQQVRRAANNQNYQFNVYAPQVAAENPAPYYPGYAGFAPATPYFYAYNPAARYWNTGVGRPGGVGGVGGIGRPGGGHLNRPIGGRRR